MSTRSEIASALREEEAVVLGLGVISIKNHFDAHKEGLITLDQLGVDISKFRVLMMQFADLRAFVWKECGDGTDAVCPYCKQPITVPDFLEANHVVSRHRLGKCRRKPKNEPPLRENHNAVEEYQEARMTEESGP